MPSLRCCAILLALQFVGGETPEALTVELKPKTLDGFARYVQAAEARIAGQVGPSGPFLYLEELPEPRRSQTLALLKRGEIFMEPLTVRDNSGKPIKAPDGIIHHWIGAAFISGISLDQALALLQDYNRHQDIYKPEVARSRLLGRNDDDFKVYYRLRKKKVITVTLNTEHDAHYTRVDSTHCFSQSHSTRIAEVENADQPNEREKPIGHDGGFLWRMNSYWRFQERDGGVYIECESVSLTRDIPTGLGWLIKPFITGVPRESLQMTLGSTRDALLAKRGAGGE